MPHPLIEEFLAIEPLSAEEISAIERSMVIRRYPAGHLLLRQGEIADLCFFVVSGCIRQFTAQNGEERTTAFFTEGNWVVSLDSFTRKVPATHSWHCIETTEVVVGNEQRESDLLNQHPGLGEIARKVVERLLAANQQETERYLVSTPEQRYTFLLTERPDLISRVPQYFLASYIGVQPESLSRIRRRISSVKTEKS